MTAYQPVIGSGVNPARAGMIPASSPAPRRGRGKPRASGDDPKLRIPEMDVIQ